MMSLARRNPKRDGNEAAIVNSLRRLGATVARISGHGLPDLLVGWRGKWVLVEIKQKGKETCLTTAQEVFFRAARDRHLPLLVCTDAGEVMTGIAALASPGELINAWKRPGSARSPYSSRRSSGGRS